MSNFKTYIKEDSSNIIDKFYEFLRSNSSVFRNLPMDEQGKLMISIKKILKGKI